MQSLVLILALALKRKMKSLSLEALLGIMPLQAVNKPVFLPQNTPKNGCHAFSCLKNVNRGLRVVLISTVVDED